MLIVCVVWDYQIISTTHVLAAVFRAANDFLNGRLKSRNVHSEIVVCLGGNNNVGVLSPFLPPPLFYFFFFFSSSFFLS